MTSQEFKKTLLDDFPPKNIADLLEALWYDAKGNWEKAHEIAQKDEGNYIYDRIHAYLHRKEGDIFNAKYWYRRINADFPTESLEKEWEGLVDEYLA
ncbi:MAG: hypothetical protein V4683_10830 [Bacteroidota bacterium]